MVASTILAFTSTTTTSTILASTSTTTTALFAPSSSPSLPTMPTPTCSTPCEILIKAKKSTKRKPHRQLPQLRALDARSFDIHYDLSRRRRNQETEGDLEQSDTRGITATPHKGNRSGIDYGLRDEREQPTRRRAQRSIPTTILCK